MSDDSLGAVRHFLLVTDGQERDLEQAPEVQALIDKQSIRELIMRYCRAVDRCDRDAFRAVYWPDAIDDHGIYTGSGEGFVDFALERLHPLRTQHFIGNVLIEMDGENSAFAESYFIAFHQGATHFGGEEFTLGGRYLDHLEKRGDEWRFLRRTVAYDYTRSAATTETGRYDEVEFRGSKFPDDPVYRLLSGALDR